MVAKLTEIIRDVEACLHVLEPVLFKATLFIWGGFEMCKFLYSVVSGHPAG